jgi:molybdopterin adenylyltransferase
MNIDEACPHVLSMSLTEHRREAPASVAVHIVTVSDTRTLETDTSGTLIASLLDEGGHRIAGRTVLKEEPADVRRTVEALVRDEAVDVVITTGGTGITARDSTFEAIDGLLEKRLVGFGELFRMLSYQEIGAAAMLSRATAGLTTRTVILALPGSEHAVRLAMEKLVLPELGHLVREARR